MVLPIPHQNGYDALFRLQMLNQEHMHDHHASHRLGCKAISPGCLEDNGPGTAYRLSWAGHEKAQMTSSDIARVIGEADDFSCACGP